MTLDCQHQAPLADLNTLRLPATAARLLRVDSPATLAAALPDIAGEKRRFVLGGGSNLVLCGDFDGLVLHVALPGRAFAGEDAEAFYVSAGAGENWHDFVQWTLAQGRPGLENLSLIPGTVGAAPIQNIGAYGLEVGERLAWLDAVDLDSGETRRFDAATCGFGYRDSVFKREGWHLCGRFLIVSVTFRLAKAWTPLTRYADVAAELDAAGVARPTPADVAAAVIAVRRRKLPDPAALPNAGSFFQNPTVSAAEAARLQAAHPALPTYAQADGRVKLAAGWLIEQAGWKGRNLGPVGMFEKQALVLVNRGGARGADVRALAQAVQADVLARFGVRLEAEPIYLGAA
ncbi:MAG: UDP-N-acetylmuramate dehydrogenase [Rhodocyclaceae bacterium]|nr:UDP-N-acetylmuramate dehydrogenase [Rhodocyclaceae bacterium]